MSVKKSVKKKQEEHTGWRCKAYRQSYTFQACNIQNNMSDKECFFCNNARGAGAEALNDRGETVGILLGVYHDNGEEVWDYLYEAEDVLNIGRPSG